MDFTSEFMLSSGYLRFVKGAPKKLMIRSPWTGGHSRSSSSYNSTPVKRRKFIIRKEAEERTKSRNKDEVIFNAYKDILPQKLSKLRVAREESTTMHKGLIKNHLHSESTYEYSSHMNPHPIQPKPKNYIQSSYGLAKSVERILRESHQNMESGLRVLSSMGQRRYKRQTVQNHVNKKKIVKEKLDHGNTQFQEFVLRLNDYMSESTCNSVAEICSEKSSGKQSVLIKEKYNGTANLEILNKEEKTSRILERNVCDGTGKKRKRIIILQKFTPLNQSLGN